MPLKLFILSDITQGYGYNMYMQMFNGEIFSEKNKIYKFTVKRKSEKI